MRGLGGDGGARLASAQRDNALRLAHAAPHAIRLSGTKGVLAAQLENWARVADGFRAVFTLGASPSAFPVWVIKHVRILSAACALKLPIPKIRIGAGKRMRLRHVQNSFVGWHTKRLNTVRTCMDKPIQKY